MPNKPWHNLKYYSKASHEMIYFPVDNITLKELFVVCNASILKICLGSMECVSRSRCSGQTGMYLKCPSFALTQLLNVKVKQNNKNSKETTDIPANVLHYLHVLHTIH